MPNDSPTPPRRKLSIYWWLGGGSLVLTVLFLFQLFGPSSRIIVSKQTTYITEPLRSDGLPDYEEYVRRKASEGVTPENNAATLLFTALWPAYLEPHQYRAVATELGLKDIRFDEQSLQPLNSDELRKRFLAWLPKSDESGIEPDVDAIIESAQKHSWQSDQLPPLAEWVDANREPLDLIVQASLRPRYYAPSPTLLNGQHDMLITVLLPGAQAIRDAARGLAVRTMWHLGEGRPQAAWNDTLALYRLSALATQGASAVEKLVAMAVRQLACEATLALLSSDQLTKQLAEQIHSDLSKVAPFATIADCVDQFERLSMLDTVVNARLHGFGALATDGTSREQPSPVHYASIDWNLILRQANQVYDEAAAAMRVRDRHERQQALNSFISNLEASSDRPNQLLLAFISRSVRSEVIGTIMINLMVPAVDAALSAEERTNSELLLMQIASGIAVYHVERGTYPEKLGDLSPAVLKQPPLDSYHASPFVYKRTADGYLLYTIGENDRDDAGNNQRMDIFEGQSLDRIDQEKAAALRDKIPGNSDDIAIRIPTPPFELPSLKPTQ